MVIDIFSLDTLSTAFVAGFTTSILSRRESRSGLIQLFANPEWRRPVPDSALEQVPTSDAASELNFTRSLLALSTIGLQARDGSPEPGSAESSSLVSVRHAQSKNPDRAL